MFGKQMKIATKPYSLFNIRRFPLDVNCQSSQYFVLRNSRQENL